MSVFSILFLWITIGENEFPDNNVVTELPTHSVKLNYSPATEPVNSMVLASRLGGLGLIDITKLDPKEEIESLNIRYAEITSSPFRAQLVMVDANRNGMFEYDSTDLFGLTSFDEQFQIANVNFTRSNQAVALKIDTQTYLLHFDADGSTVRLSNLPGNHTSNEITFPYRLPDLDVRPLTKNAKLNKSNGRYTYVEFWGTWCKPCLKLVPEIQSLKKMFGEKLNIVSIDYGDNDTGRVKEHIVRYQMNWDHLIANKALINKFAVHSFPCGLLFDPAGNLIEYGISPAKVGEILQTKN